jgi:hypothetical protein
LRGGTFTTLYASGKKNVYTFLRRLDDEVLVVIFNNSDGKYKVRVPVDGELSDATTLDDCLGGGRCVVKDGRIVGAVMPPLSGLVLQALPGTQSPLVDQGSSRVSDRTQG